MQPDARASTTAATEGKSRAARRGDDRRTRSHLKACALLALAACATSRPSEAREPAPATAGEPRSASELAVREPSASPASGQSGAALGTLAPTMAVAPPLSPTERAQPEASGGKGDLPAPIRLAATPAPRPYPLEGNDFVLPSGLRVHRVPKGFSVRAGRDENSDDAVWEFLDRRGHRIALLQERSFRRAATATAPVLEATSIFRTQMRRDDWLTGPTQLIIERFRGEHHIYTLERLAFGTDWIPGGLELTRSR